MLQAAEYNAQRMGEDIVLAYSGGKDSDICLDLCRKAGVAPRIEHKVTYMDSAQTMAHIKANGAELVRKRRPFVDVIRTRGIPSRQHRWCCEVYKEYATARYTIMGIRAAESARRARAYQEPEQCRKYHNKSRTIQVLPILHWTNEDVLQYIEREGLELCATYYDEDGRVDVTRRVGCRLCPLQTLTGRQRDALANPHLVKLWIRAADEFLATHPTSPRHAVFYNGTDWFVATILCDGIGHFWRIFGEKSERGADDCKKWLDDIYKKGTFDAS